MSGWVPALRIARRELLRARGRALLVLAMVLLPVTAVAALSTLLRTSEIDPVEGLPSSLGSASARLDAMDGRVQQDPFLKSSGQYGQGRRATEAEVLERLPAGSRLLAVRESYDALRLVDGERGRRVTLVAVDLREGATAGPFRIVAGRAPRTADEIAVPRALAEDGVAVSDTVRLDDEPRTVTGVVELPRGIIPDHTVLGLPAAVGLEDAPTTRWWATGPPVVWADVRQLNEIGVAVLSRAVVLDPPPDDQVTELAYADDSRRVTLAIIGLIAVMAVIEVVLLAGPAFAVGARRSRRSLALLAAGGGEPSHVRRVVLAQGLLVGLVAAGVGVPLGVATAALARAPLTRFADASWGPFDVSAVDLVLVALLGAGTALLAALLPAAAMARQPVVAALQGRRITSAGARRPALLGMVLIAVGIVVTFGALDGFGAYGQYAEIGVAAGAIPTVLGAVLLAPAVLSLLGRVAGRLPLALRFAVRDADRQRGRTAPAVAAIAATVAGVVALGTAASSDAEQNRLSYRPSGPSGSAVVASYGLELDVAAVRAASREALPGVSVTEVRGLAPVTPSSTGHTELQVCRRSERAPGGRCSELIGEYSSGFGSDVLVGASGLRALGDGLRDGALASAERALAEGRIALASPIATPGERVELRLTRFEIGADGQERATVLTRVAAPVEPLGLAAGVAPLRAVVPEELARQLGPVETVGLVVGDDLTRRQERALQEAVRTVDDGLSVRVERGYEDTGDRTVLLVLALVAGTLVLAGTLAATSLALSEARPDLTTLGQVGARPRTRRAVAAGYALVLGVAGAGLGVVAGLVPGVAAAVPLTRGYASSGPLGAPVTPSFVVDVPWALLALVLVALPLVSAVVAGAAARSRFDGARRVTG